MYEPEGVRENYEKRVRMRIREKTVCFIEKQMCLCVRMCVSECVNVYERERERERECLFF